MEIKRIGPLSVARISAWIYGLFGLIVGIFISFFSLLGFATGGGESGPEAFFGIFFGVGAIIFMPIFYAILGFLSSLLMAFVYNLVARYSGGIEIEFAQPPATSGESSPNQPG
jgi:hypothetical protein